VLFDFEHFETPPPAHADVCIVGAGAAGIVLACRLAAQGLRVTLLEGGGPQLEHRSQALYQSEMAGVHNRGVQEGRFRTLGGTTTEWGGQVLELDDLDFKERPHVPGSGWPFPKSELRRYYDQAVQFESLEQSQPGTAEGRAAVLKQLGIPHISLEPDFLLPFSRWCPVRNFAILHRSTLENTLNLAVYLHSNAVEFLLNDSGDAVRTIRIRNYQAREALVTAENFVLCMGGIETTRLLCQPAAQGTFPWHTNGMLGRFYKDHIRCDDIPVHSTQVKPLRRYFGMVNSGGFTYQAKLQLGFAQQDRLQTLNIAGSINPHILANPARDAAIRTLRRLRRRSGELTAKEIASAATHVPELALNWVRYRLNDGLPAWRRTMLRVHSEQEPLSPSRLSLSGQRDELGLLRTRLDWRISREEIASIRRFVKTAGEALLHRGLGRIDPPKDFFTDDAVVLARCRDSNHHMGTTRMSASASDGVVDPNLLLHGLRNTYVCSASVFPTTGFSNPTHTVLALALRLADRLILQH